jgi:hypothetical protein
MVKHLVMMEICATGAVSCFFVILGATLHNLKNRCRAFYRERPRFAVRELHVCHYIIKKAP